MPPPNAPGNIRKGADMARNTPPHPNNSGPGAISAGVSALKANMAEKPMSVTRAGDSKG